MGHRLATLPDSYLERAASDTRLRPSERRAIQHELERRARNDKHCPNGAGCTDWQCTKDHTGGPSK